MDEIKRYSEILQSILEGKGIPKGEESFFANYSGKIDETAMAKVNDAVAGVGGYTPAEAAEAMRQGYLQMIQSPEHKDKMLKLAEASAKGKTAEQVRTVLNTALAVGDIATSASQIKQSDRMLRRSRRPGHTPLAAEPLLKSAIANAQAGTFDAARRISPAQQAIIDQYLGDLSVAKSVSGGQAGTYGALAQVASGRRGRGAVQLAPVVDDIRFREQGRLDNLIGMKIGENQAIQNTAAQYYPYDLQQYQYEQQAANQLGSTGRLNLRNSLVNLGQFIPDAAANLATRQRFNSIRSQMAGAYGDQIGKIAEEADRNLLMRQYDPTYQSQYSKVYGTLS